MEYKPFYPKFYNKEKDKWYVFLGPSEVELAGRLMKIDPEKNKLDPDVKKVFGLKLKGGNSKVDFADIFAIEEQEQIPAAVTNKYTYITDVAIYPDDSIEIVQKKIEVYCKIPVIYQLIYTEEGAISFGYYGISLEFPPIAGTINAELFNKSHFILGQKYDQFTMINLLDYIENNMDISVLRSADYRAINELYNVLILKYWPMVSSAEFTNIINGKYALSAEYEQFPENTEKLRTISHNDISELGIKVTTNLPTRRRKVLKFRDKFNLYYIFDQFPISKRYPLLIVKFDEIRYYKKHLESDTQYVKTIRVPEAPGIEINAGESFIKEDGYIYHSEEGENLENIIAELIGENPVVDQQIRFHYNFKLYLGTAVSYDKLYSVFSKFPEYVDRDYKNPTMSDSLSFYYQRVNITADEFDRGSVGIRGYVHQYGVYVRITSQGEFLDITLANVKDIDDVSLIVNFIVRVCYLYALEFRAGRRREIVRARVKDNLKNIDPKLFGVPIKKNTSQKSKTYTRICQAAKQPTGYFKNSEVYQEFVKKNPNLSETVIANLSYSGKETALFCPSKKYKNLIFMPGYTHPSGACIPCCSVKDKSKTSFHQTCLAGKFNDNLLREMKMNKTNMYYIREYDPGRPLANNKLSYLPKVLGQLLNMQDCKIRNNTIDSGGSCYLLMGKQTEDNLSDILPLDIDEDDEYLLAEKYQNADRNLILFEYNFDTNAISTLNFFTAANVAENLEKSPVIVALKSTADNIVRYNLVVQVSQINGKYKTIETHPIDSRISKILRRLYAGLSAKITENSDTKHPDLEAILARNFRDVQQFLPLQTGRFNMVSHVILDKIVKFPIRTSTLRNDIPINKTYEAINEKKNVDAILEKYFPDLSIRRIVLDKSGKLIGYELNTEYLIFFAAVRDKIPRRDFMIFYYEDDGNEYEVNDNDLVTNPALIEQEQYSLLFAHIAYYLNKKTSSVPDRQKSKIFVPENHSIADWEKLLLEVYDDNKDPRFINDYVAIRSGNVGNLQYYRPLKNKLINYFRDAPEYDIKIVRNILENVIMDYITFIPREDQEITENNIRKLCPTDGKKGSLTRQCDGDKLRIPKKKFEIYMQFIARQIAENEYKRKQLIENIISPIINSTSFSRVPGVSITRINEER